MVPSRQKRVLLGALVTLVLVAAAVAWRWRAGPAAPSSNGVAERTRPARPAAAGTPAVAPDVHLKALGEQRTKPGETRRNLFTFKTAPLPQQPSTGVRSTPPPVGLNGPPPPPPVPPIALKFIGIIERTNAAQRLAILSDGRGGPPISGKEGDIIEGRYRILRIGNESIEMAYLDGRGRQTIRLTGS